jgi:hypothetical protein
MRYRKGKQLCLFWINRFQGLLIPSTTRRNSLQISSRSFHAAGQSDSNLQKERQLARGSVFDGHTKMDSTVRYLGVEQEDALAISEAFKI